MSKQGFEKELEKLETCIEVLGQPNIPLNESLNNFEKGVALFRECQELLDLAKHKVLSIQSQEHPSVEPAENFEHSLKNLESCVEELGKPDIALHDALLNFEKGVTLFRTCQEHLNRSKQKVIELNFRGGSLQETPRQK